MKKIITTVFRFKNKLEKREEEEKCIYKKKSKSKHMAMANMNSILPEPVRGNHTNTIIILSSAITLNTVQRILRKQTTTTNLQKQKLLSL